MAARTPRTVLVAAGLEPAGRVGLLADVHAVEACHVRAVGVTTAVTAQGVKTFASEPVSPALLRAQVRGARELGRVEVVKLGLVASRAQLRVLSETVGD